MTKTGYAMGFKVLGLLLSFAAYAAVPNGVKLDGDEFRGHIQGVCTDGTNIYWSMTYDLVKTDMAGRELARYSDKFHMGDPCWHRGRIYVGVNRMVEKGVRRGDEVWVFEPERLERVKVYPTPQTIWCNNGLEWYGGRFWIVSCTPTHSRYNYVFEYTEDFKFVQCRPIESGWTLVGVQTICLWGDKMLFGCYGSSRDPVMPHKSCTFAVDVKDLARKSDNVEFPFVVPVSARVESMSAEGMFAFDGGIWTAHGINRSQKDSDGSENRHEGRKFGARVLRNKVLERKLDAALGGRDGGAAGTAVCVAPFKDGETVVFLGDSITHGGRYVADLQLLWSLRHPGSNVTFHNAGIGGQRANHGLVRYDWDVAPLKPDRVFIMFGMNDVARDERWAPPETPEKLKLRAELTHTYETNLVALVRKVRAAGAVPVVMTPTPFDQYTSSTNVVNCPGTDDPGLKSFAAKAREVAAAEKAEVVELYDYLAPILKANPDKKFLKDRVHPGLEGHLLIAALVLRAMGEDDAVGTATFDASSGGRRFVYRPRRLPYPTCREYAVADSVWPLTGGFNREIVKVVGLPEGSWTLRLGEVAYGTFTAKELSDGVNVTTTDEKRYSPSLKASGVAWSTMSSFHAEQSELRVLAQTFYQVKRLGGDVSSLDSCLEKYDEWISAYRQKPELMRYYVLYSNKLPMFKKKYLDRENCERRISELREKMWCLQAEPYVVSVERN